MLNELIWGSKAPKAGSHLLCTSEPKLATSTYYVLTLGALNLVEKVKSETKKCSNQRGTLAFRCEPGDKLWAIVARVRISAFLRNI